ncbi:EamA family transporter [Actinotalea sp.]|uniref:EamA family transporter n=1 Tax=Actinotalea sp. TaxID=1872145 RepID=UPI003561B3C0
MEDTRRWTALTAIAPITWGSTYLVTAALLPAEAPLWGAVLRALPAGLLLLLLARERPRGAWWWRAPLIGTMTVGAFFVLVYVVAQRLPSGLAATMMAVSPAVMMLLAWPMLGLRPQRLPLMGAALGFLGVCAMLLTGVTAVDPVGVLASLAAMAMASVGFLLSRRWAGEVAVLPATAWQLVAGGLVVLPFALVIEGAPPELDGPAVAGFVYLSMIATALAYVLWFGGLARLEPGTVGLLGLLNPVVGVVLGAVLVGERFGLLQVAGMALVIVGITLGRPTATGGTPPVPELPERPEADLATAAAARAGA